MMNDNKMKHIFIRENHDYEMSDIVNLLDAKDDKEDIFNELMEYRLIISENGKCRFNYVGLILIDNKYVFNCYPKYITDENNIKKDFKLILKAVKKYIDSKNDFNRKDLEYQNEDLDENPFDLLSLMLFFIEDYYQNGVYTNIQNLLEINGNGEINWDKTVNYTYPIVKNNKPYYTELHTRYKYNDLNDYFRLLHEYIITDCSINLENADLLEYFDLMPVELSDKSRYDFGGDDFILKKLEKELKMEFNTQKRKLLKSMHAYISHKKSFSDDNIFTLYGVYKYEYVWEEMCSKVLNNLLYKPPLKDLIDYIDDDDLKNRLVDLINYTDNPDSEIKLVDLIKYVNDDSKSSLMDLIKFKNNYDSILKLINNIKYRKSSGKEVRLFDLIDKANWVLESNITKAKFSLEPDLITFYEDKFLIFDAKYYDLTFEDEKLSNNPGIGDITKQYLYELAYKDFIDYMGFKEVKNVFLMPTYGPEIENNGYVELEMLHNLGLKNIQIIKLPAQEINQLYLKGEDMELSRLYEKF